MEKSCVKILQKISFCVHNHFFGLTSPVKQTLRGFEDWLLYICLWSGGILTVISLSHH